MRLYSEDSEVEVAAKFGCMRLHSEVKAVARHIKVAAKVSRMHLCSEVEAVARHVKVKSN